MEKIDYREKSTSFATNVNIRGIEGIFIILSLSLLLVTYKFNSYVMFHTFVESFIIFICFSIFIISINSYNISNANYFTFLAISFGFIGFFRLLHMVSYQGVGIFYGNSSNIATQLWIISRYLESLSLLASFTYFRKDIKPKLTIGIFLLISFILTMMILKWNIFPICYIPGLGLTTFKKISEYIISLLFSASLFFLKKNKHLIEKNIHVMLSCFIYLSIASEFCFTLYIGVYDVVNFTGHILNMASYYFLYKALIETTLKRPLETLFSDLSSVKQTLESKNFELQDTIERLQDEIENRIDFEKRLKSAEEKYEKIVNLSPDAIYIQDKGKLLYINKAGMDFFGVKNSDDIIGRTLFELADNDYHGLILERVHTAQNLRVDCPVAKIDFHCLDGLDKTMEVTATPIDYNNEQLMLSIGRDVTWRKRLEEEEKNLKEAREYEKLMTEFFANISHELRTPINVIYSATQTMQSQTVNSSPCLYDKYIAIIKQNSLRLIRIINNIIDITKIDSGFLQPCFKNLDIINVIEDITQSVEEYARNKSIEIIFDTDSEEKIMSFDPDLMERMMLNLLSNAVKFTREGGTIEINVWAEDNSVVICIKDSGIGIPENKKDIIFDRFRQIDKSFIRENEGSGIGLSLVKSIVDMHQGSIFVNSKVGQGSEFIIELPSTLESMDDEVSCNGIEKSKVEQVNIEFSDIYF